MIVNKYLRVDLHMPKKKKEEQTGDAINICSIFFIN